MKRDVILTALSCGGKMKCSKEAQKFEQSPIVINVPGGSSEGFIQTAKAYKQSGSILDKFLLSRLKKTQPRRICLVGFADGATWLTEVLKNSLDHCRIDTVIVLDGVLATGKAGWVDFGQRAANGGPGAPRLWIAHSQYKSPNARHSSKSTSAKLFKEAAGKSEESSLPSYIVSNIQDSITVYSKIERPRRKIYHSDTLTRVDQRGSLVKLSYDGSKHQDQLYILQYVQPRLWQWLAEVWSDESTGVFY